MRLDRSDMRKILEVLYESYPENVGTDELVAQTGLDEADIAISCIYLDEHELVAAEISQTLDSSMAESVVWAKITARGIDFIRDDGGLSAILGVVTVKLHEETIRDLLLGGVAASPAPEAEKSALREAIKKAPATAFNSVVQGLIGVAMSKGPEAVQFLANHFLGAV